MVTKNYGLTGGTLDSTKHLEAAIPRLMNAQEIDAHRLRNLHGGGPTTPTDVLNIVIVPGRQNAESN